MAEIPLAPYAMDVRKSRGRRYPEAPHPYRNDYARDRDRIIHSRAFRRLEAKTQVFTSRFSDHFRNRLTHTLEVVQVARTVADALDLNADLAEALALVHDIGHPPFGHAGERKLDARMRQHGEHFDHNLHALRIVEQFEQRYLDFPGLNLTFEVREGIVKHSRDYSALEFPELAEYLLEQRPPLESQLIDWVDEIAYNMADLDDAFEARLLDLETLRAEAPIFAEAWNSIAKSHTTGATKLKFNEALRIVFNQITTDLIDNTRREVFASGAQSVDDIRNLERRLAGFSPPIADQNVRLKRFLSVRIYSHGAIADDRNRSVDELDSLFQFFLDHPDRMPPLYAQQAGRTLPARVVCDYIAGMTDHFLLRQCREFLRDRGPQSGQAVTV
jgi:dGTPase